MDNQLSMTSQFDAVSKRVNVMPRCIDRRTSSRTIEVIFTLHYSVTTAKMPHPVLDLVLQVEEGSEKSHDFDRARVMIFKCLGLVIL